MVSLFFFVLIGEFPQDMKNCFYVSSMENSLADTALGCFFYGINFDALTSNRLANRNENLTSSGRCSSWRPQNSVLDLLSATIRLSLLFQLHYVLHSAFPRSSHIRRGFGFVYTLWSALVGRARLFGEQAQVCTEAPAECRKQDRPTVPTVG
jgi:hypothetical protein